MDHYMVDSLFVKNNLKFMKKIKNIFFDIKIYFMKLRLKYISMKIKALNKAQNKKLKR